MLRIARWTHEADLEESARCGDACFEVSDLLKYLLNADYYDEQTIRYSAIIGTHH